MGATAKLWHSLFRPFSRYKDPCIKTCISSVSAIVYCCLWLTHVISPFTRENVQKLMLFSWDLPLFCTSLQCKERQIFMYCHRFDWLKGTVIRIGKPWALYFLAKFFWNHKIAEGHFCITSLILSWCVSFEV